MMRIIEEEEFKSYWYINRSLSWDGTALFLFKNGTYKKCGWSNAQLMTSTEAKEALRKLNSRLPRPASMMDYMPDWN